MQLIDLLKGISAKEQETLLKLIESQQRETLTALYNSLLKLVKRDEAYNSKTVFEEVFQLAFTSSKNYLLYNEIRNLKQVITRFLAITEMEKELDSNEDTFNEYYLKALSSRKIEDAFQSHMDKTLETAANTFKSEVLCQLYELKHQHYISLAYQSPLAEEEHIKLLNRWMDEEEKKLHYTFRSIESSKAYLLRALANRRDYMGTYSNTLEFTPKTQVTFAEKYDLPIRYLELVRDQYIYRGETRVEKIKEALSVLREIDERVVERYDKELDLLYSISTGLVTIRRYDEALGYLDECVDFAKKHQLKMPESIYHTYMVYYLMEGHYAEGVQYYQQNETEIKLSAYAIPAGKELAFCYVFLGKTIEANDVAQEFYNVNSKHEGFLRTISIICFITEQQYDQAKREIKNLKRSSNYNPQNTGLVMRLRLFDKYCDAMLGNPDLRNKKLQETLEELQANDDMELISASTLWFRKEIERTLK